MDKPFSVKLLSAHIDRFTRERKGSASSGNDELLQKVGNILLDLRNRAIVTENGKIKELRPMEFNILKKLVENFPHTVSRDDICYAAWDGQSAYYNDQSLNNYIRRLRNLLEEETNLEIQLFEQKQVRTHWDGQEEKWYFSVSDVVQILSESTDVKQYIKKMRSRDTELNVNWGTICTPVVMIAADGKKRKIQAADTEGIFRIIQSIPSKKAEPFKQWLAKVGRERIDEINDPEIGIDRLMETYLRKGYSAAWINQRLKSIEVRRELTDEWDKRGVKKGQEYAILTDEITKAWSGLSGRVSSPIPVLLLAWPICRAGFSLNPDRQKSLHRW